MRGINMRICDNGVYRDMTAEEEKAYKISVSSNNEEDKLTMLENDKLTKLEEQITDIQEALCELYESIV